MNNWRDDAACRDANPDLFFDPDRIADAMAYCRACPVAEECLADARTTKEHEGVRGGVDLAAEARRQRTARTYAARQRRAVELPARPCRRCGTMFKPRQAGRLYCSETCTRAVHAATQAVSRRRLLEASWENEAS